MKKEFIIPEISSFELTPENDVMQTSANLTHTYAVKHATGIDDDVLSEYDKWKGMDAWI